MGPYLINPAPTRQLQIFPEFRCIGTFWCASKKALPRMGLNLRLDISCGDLSVEATRGMPNETPPKDTA
jgi:hypothetical protein